MAKGQTETIKILGGEWRGCEITTPGGRTHPMGSRERLALFNIIGEKVEGAKVLDAYAGSGAIGFEAFSRGARMIVFVEKNRVAARTIYGNIARLNPEEGGMLVFRGPVDGFWQQVFGLGAQPRDYVGPNDGKHEIESKRVLEFPETYDVIVADPPYDRLDLSEVELLRTFLAPEGVMVLSHPPGMEPELMGLVRVATHEYARARLSVYLKAKDFDDELDGEFGYGLDDDFDDELDDDGYDDEDDFDDDDYDDCADDDDFYLPF